MATIIKDENRQYSEDPHPIHWDAVFAGVVFTFALSWLLFVLGSAIGLSVFEFFDPYDQDFKPEMLTLNISVLVWTFLSALVAFYMGGVLTGRLTGKADRTVGLLHGIVLWASVMIVSILLSTVGVSGIVNTAMNAVKSGAHMGAAAYGSSDRDRGTASIPPYLQPLIAELKRNISQSVAANANTTVPGQNVSPQAIQRATDQLEPYTLAQVANALINGNTEQAKNIIAGSTALTDAEIDQLVNTAKAKSDQIANDLKQRADKAEDYLAGLLWIVFISSAAALLASIFGGWSGVDSHTRIRKVRIE